MFFSFPKKERERYILNMIYDELEYKKIINRESPDFEIERNSFSFGVEIAEFYFSGSNARLRNIKSYYDEILLHEKYRHKDDKKILEPGEFTIQRKDECGDYKNVARVRGIIQKLPTSDEYSSMIADLIKEKNTRYEHYDKRLNHINLILYDTENRLSTILRKEFFGYFFTEKVVEIILESKYREIYLITSLENNQLYFPLKMIYVLAKLFLIDYFIINEKHSLSTQDENTWLSLLADYLISVGINEKIYLLDENQLICGNYGFLITKDGSINIRDYNDYKTPNHAKTYRYIKYLDKNMFRQIKDCENGTIFTAEIGFDVRK